MLILYILSEESEETFRTNLLFTTVPSDTETDGSEIKFFNTLKFQTP